MDHLPYKRGDDPRGSDIIPKMTLTVAEVEHIAALARLKLTEAEKARYREQISSILDYFSLMGKSLYITGIEVPSECGSGLFGGSEAGVWHKEWDTKRQALWLDQFYRIAMSKPMVDAMVYGNLVDREGSTIANSGLMTGSLEAKDGYLVMKRLRELIHSKK